MLFRSGGRAYHTHGKSHVVIDGHVVDEAEILEDNPHLTADIGNFPLGQPSHIHSVHDNLAGIGPLFTHDKFQEGAFACAGRSDDKDKLALIHRKVDIVEGLCAIVIHL